MFLRGVGGPRRQAKLSREAVVIGTRHWWGREFSHGGGGSALKETEVDNGVGGGEESGVVVAIIAGPALFVSIEGRGGRVRSNRWQKHGRATESDPEAGWHAADSEHQFQSMARTVPSFRILGGSYEIRRRNCAQIDRWRRTE
jgi:hypothetical protein